MLRRMPPEKHRLCRLEGLEQRIVPSTISDLAYQLGAARVVEPQQNFFVYKDQDSAFNHGFPSGLFANTSATISKLHIDTGAIDDPSSSTGVSTDPNRLDRARGNVLRLTFDPLQAGEFVGLNVEEPENWGANQRGIGYALRGVTDLVLDARSPTPGGIRVQFGVGLRQTPFMLIPQSSTYTTLTIPLNTLIGGAPDLSSVHVLLTVGTNDVNAPNGGTLLIDNVRLTPVPAAALAVPSLPLATQTFGVIPLSTHASGRIAFPPDQVLRNPATAYESSLLLLALLDRGRTEDLAPARRIADGLVYALRHDNHGLPLPVAPGGATGLHNATFAGDLTLLNDQAPGLARAGDVRLAGFSCGDSPSGFCLFLDGATGGNNAFAMLALTRAYRVLGDTRYLDAARTIGNWIIGNLADTSGTGFGGFFLGYPDMGQAKVLEHSKSVENNADIFSALTQLAAVERGLGNAAAADTWTAWANRAGDFVMAMFDPALGRFYAGTVPVGTPARPGINPTGSVRGNDVVNVFDFLDSDSFTTLALAGAPRYRNAIDWHRPVQYVLDHFAQSVTAGGRSFSGFDIVSQPTAGPNGVAWEFTGQAIVLMRYVDRLYGESRFKAQADAYLQQIAQAQASAPFADGLGLVASTVQGGDTLPPIEQALSTPFQDIPERVGLAATTWAIFADQWVNVLSPPAYVSGVLVNGGAAQRSRVADVTIVFSTIVSLPADPRLAFRLTRTGPGSPAGDVTLAVDLSGSTAAQTVVRLTFLGSLTQFGSLIDGNYSLTVLSSQVAGPDGPLDGDGDGRPGGDFGAKFYRFFGDVNGDKKVDALDLFAFAGSFGKKRGDAGYLDYLDSNNDGVVDALDLFAFAGNFGKTLP